MSVNGSTATATAVNLTRKDYETGQEVRWCPGGDPAMTAQSTARGCGTPQAE